jgi:hypothetical protein
VTTPEETTPPPPTTTDPGVTEEEPPGPDTITLIVPPLPAPRAAAAKQQQKVVRPRPKVVRKAARPAAHRAVERETPSADEFAPVEVEVKAKPKAKAKAKAKQPRRPEPRLTAPAALQRRPLREPEPAHGVLAVQHTTRHVGSTPTTNTAVLYFSITLATVLGMLLCAVGAAPRLAGRWPHVFVPVIDATERIVLAGVCLAGAALTLAITWALTGPGG